MSHGSYQNFNFLRSFEMELEPLNDLLVWEVIV